MADTLLDGKLAERLAKYRADGLTWEDISRRLYDEAKVEVSHVTLRSWAKALGIGVAA